MIRSKSGFRLYRAKYKKTEKKIQVCLLHQLKILQSMKPPRLIKVLQLINNDSSRNKRKSKLEKKKETSEREVTVKRRRKSISTKKREEVERRKKSKDKGKKVKDMIGVEAKKNIRNRRSRKIKSVDRILTKKITEKAMFDCCTYEIYVETMFLVVIIDKSYRFRSNGEGRSLANSTGISLGKSDVALLSPS